MRPVNRYPSQLLFRKSYRPKRNNVSRPAPKLNLSFRPSRAGPIVIPIYEWKSD
jgi:hypothetical protein